MRSLTAVSCVAVMMTLVACGSSSSSSVVAALAPARCQVSITASTTSFGPEGGTGTLAVTVPRDCIWNASSQTSWISITSPPSGQGDAVLGYRVAPNGDPVTRRGDLAVSDTMFVLTQGAAPWVSSNIVSLTARSPRRVTGLRSAPLGSPEPHPPGRLLVM